MGQDGDPGPNRDDICGSDKESSSNKSITYQESDFTTTEFDKWDLCDSCSTHDVASCSSKGLELHQYRGSCDEFSDVNNSRRGTDRVDPNLCSIAEPDVLFDASTGFDRYNNYAPVQFIPGITCESTRSFDHEINSLGSQFNVDAWRHELSFETDYNLRQYLWFGVTNGFYIVDQNVEIPTYECRNYKSALVGDAFEFVDKLIHEELAQSKYRLAPEVPHCVHSIGAVPKKGTNKWHPITDCKRPIGDSINCFMTSTFRDFCYTTVDQVVNLITPNCFMSSVDIKAAYRSVLVHPSQWTYQGVSWQIDGRDTYLYDTHVCFGLRCAPYLFTQISNFVLRCLQRRGFMKCVSYLDDFLIIEDFEEACRKGQETLIKILRSLGFYIAWEKCCSPSQCVTYLGVQFNSHEMSVSLPLEKMEKMQHELDYFQCKTRATKKQIQRLCGVLSHCSKVVKGGRTFSHRIIALLRGWPPNKKRIRLNTQFMYDIAWWRDFSKVFNGKNMMVKYNHGLGPSFYTDASFSGYGLWSNKDWQAGHFNACVTPDLSNLDPDHAHWVNVHIDDQPSCSNINVLELVPIWLCIKRLSHQWRDYHVLCYTDSASVLGMVNKGCSTNDQCMVLLRDIFWWCAIYNIHLTARHIPGCDNIVSDALSRIDVLGDLSVIEKFSLCCSISCEGGGRHGQIG